MLSRDGFEIGSMWISGDLLHSECRFEKSRHVGTMLMCEVVFSVKSKYVLRDHLELEC